MLLPPHESVFPVFTVEVGQFLLAGHTKMHQNDIGIVLEEVVKVYKHL